MKIIKQKLILVCIVFLAIFLRFYQLSANSLYWDEASLGYNAYSLLKTGTDEYGIPHPLTLRSFNDYKPAGYAYLAAASIKVFGLNEFAIRFPSALLGSLFPLAIYFFFKFAFHDKSKISLLGAFVAAASPWMIQFSRGAFEASLGLSVLAWGIVIINGYYKKLAGLTVGSLLMLSSIYAYHSNKFVAPIILAVFLLFLVLKKKISIQRFSGVIILGAVVMIPFFQSILRGYGLTRLNSVSVGFNLENYLLGFFNHFNFDLLFLNGDYNLRHHVAGFGLFHVFESILMFIGVMWWIKKFKYKVMFVLLFVVSLVPAFISKDTPHAIRSILSFPFFLTFIVYGFYEINSKWKKAIVLLFYCSFVLLYSNSLFKHYPVEAAESWQYGHKEVANYLFKENIYEKYDKIIMTTNYDQPYIYMLLYSNGRFLNLKNDGTMSAGFDRFVFRKINSNDAVEQNVLLIGTPDEIKTDSVQKIIYYPDGKIAFKIVHGS